MKTIHKKLYILTVAATVACTSFGMSPKKIKSLENYKKLFDETKQLKLLGTSETLPKLNEIIQNARNAQRQFTQKTRLPKLGAYANSCLAPCMTLGSLGYLGKKILKDRTISLPEFLICIGGTAFGLGWSQYKETLKEKLEGNIENAKKENRKTFFSLQKNLTKIIGTEEQQTGQEEKKEAFSLQDFPKNSSNLTIKINDLALLRPFKEKLKNFAQFNMHAEILSSFISRNEYSDPRISNRHTFAEPLSIQPESRSIQKDKKE